MIHLVFERCGSVETVSFILVCKNGEEKRRKVESYMFGIFFFLYIEICHV